MQAHLLGVRRKRIAHDIEITSYDTLLSKAIRAISIDHPREMWRVNELTNIRFLLLYFSTLEVMTNKVKKKKKKMLSMYLSSEGTHKVGDVELLIVQPPRVEHILE